MTAAGATKAGAPTLSAPTLSATGRLVLEVTRARARRLTLWVDALWRSGQTSPDQGPAIGLGEVARLLDAAGAAAAEAAFDAGEGVTSTEDVLAAEAHLSADPGWAALRGGFGLDGAEADLLCLLLAVEFDPGLARVVAYLHDDGRLTQPSAWLAARLARRAAVPLAAEGLTRWLLAAPLDNAPPHRLTAAWQADPAVVLSVHAGRWRDPRLADAIEERDGTGATAYADLHAEALDALRRTRDPRDVELVGPPGIGRRTLAARYAGERGLLVVDLPALLAQGLAPREALTRVLRQSRMTGALAWFSEADAVPEADWRAARALDVPFLRGVRHPTGTPVPIVLEPLSIAQRRALWERASNAPVPPALLAQRLTPAEIVRAAETPGAILAPRRGQRPDSALLTALPCRYEWDDLVLPPEVIAHLRAFEAQVRLRWSVYEEWGFHRLTHLGNGISALFGGPSGTGKTMAAQVMARSLGLDLLRVDLAGVVNKYIGETEKKLREVFDSCEDSGALLFFDEADALFGQRTQVKDAHDRFANIEIDYLLQRIERFDGVAILATNRRQDVDPAFLRRLRFVVEFQAPGPEERLALWRRALPPLTPNGEPLLEEINWQMLATTLQMTGAEIKGTALGAAFLARAEGTRIGMGHILTAARRELAKQGLRLRLPAREAAE